MEEGLRWRDGRVGRVRWVVGEKSEAGAKGQAESRAEENGFKQKEKRRGQTHCLHCTSSAAFVAHDSAHHGNCAVVNAPTCGASVLRSARARVERAAAAGARGMMGVC